MMTHRILSLPKMLLCALSLLFTQNMLGAEPFIMFHTASEAWRLNPVSIGYVQAEHSCVQLAAANLVKDFEQVTGTRPSLSAVSPQSSIIIGTVGVNPAIDAWVKQGELQNLKGKTEKYIIKTIGNQLVIAGSDKRGTVYGIYELSRQIGVSPWYYWADVPVEKHADIYVKKGEYTDGEPAVRYRGLFLNG